VAVSLGEQAQGLRLSAQRAARRPARAVALVLAGACAFATTARADDLYVDPGRAACSDAVSATVASNPATPWCSPLPATHDAGPGDVVHLTAGTYHVQVRPWTSGTSAHPLTYRAEGTVVIAPPVGSVGVLFARVHDIALVGLTVHAMATQGISIDSSSDIELDHESVTNRGGIGVWIKHGTDVTVSHSSLVKNLRAGLFDSQYATGTTLSASTVQGNGIDGQPYNGDGVELNGARETVQGCAISGNGDGIGFEHGIYVGKTASRYTISGNTIGGNAGADIKATGGVGVIADNYLSSGLYGLVISDNSAPVLVEYNLVQGRFQHGIFLTTGTTPARARLWNNTVRQTGRSTTSGDASAVFVASASQLVLRNNLLTYTNPDALGSALFVNSAALLQGLDSQTNWFSSTDARGRNLAWNGSRVTLADWRTLSGQDGASVDSTPPAFAASGRVRSPNLGRRLGTSLGLTRDLAGTALPSGTSPDIGAYEKVADSAS
jgi:Right handed beta helix region